MFKSEHFEQFKGSLVKLKLQVPFEGRRNYTGRLLGVTPTSEDIQIEVDGETFTFTLGDIDKARVVPEI